MRFPTIRARRYYRNCAALDYGLEELVGVVCSVCYHILTLHTGYELVGLSHIVLLPSSQRESQRIAEAVDTHMDLCAEPTPATTKGL